MFGGLFFYFFNFFLFFWGGGEGEGLQPEHLSSMLLNLRLYAIDKRVVIGCSNNLGCGGGVCMKHDKKLLLYVFCASLYAIQINGLQTEIVPG